MSDMTLENPALLSVFLVGLSCWGHWDSGAISDSIVWESTTSYVALQNERLLQEQTIPFLFQL